MRSSDINKLVSTVAKLVGGLMTTASHQTAKTTNSYGEITEWNTAESRKVVILKKDALKTRPDGKQVATHTQIIIPAPVPVNFTDRIKWPTDGLASTESWPIVAVESPLDSEGNPYITQVFLGYKD